MAKARARSALTHQPHQEARDVPRPQQVAPTPLTYRPEVAARVLGVSRATLYRMIAKGDLNAYKIGAATVIRHADLSRLVEAAEFAPSTKAAQDSIR